MSDDYDALRNYARHLGFHAQIHRTFDPARQPIGREDAVWYLQRSKKFGSDHEPSILKYAKAEEVRAWLDDFKRTGATDVRG